MEKEQTKRQEKKLWGDYDTEDDEEKKQSVEKKKKKSEIAEKKNDSVIDYKIIDDAAEQG